MADLSFDAVIIGGGCKGLAVGMYLAKYGGMSVGIFEDLHELGGAMAGDQIASGFQGSPHSFAQNEWYYNVVINDDLPELWEEGFKMVGRQTARGTLFPNDTCLVMYGFDTDPDGSRTAAQIARFSQRDADSYLKHRKLYLERVRPAFYEEMYSLPPLPGEPGPVAKLLASDPEFAEAGLDAHLATMTPLRGLKTIFESNELLVTMLRQAAVVGLHPDDAGTALPVVLNAVESFTHAMPEGGSHNYAHAAHRVLHKYGAKTYTHSTVDKAIIENGVATGIRLKDGTEIEAKKAIISTLSPQQLCFELIGREYLSPQICRKIDSLEMDHSNVNWYSWAFSEYPKFKAHDFNPDVDSDETYAGLTTFTFGGGGIESLIREAGYRKLHQVSPDALICLFIAPRVARLSSNPNDCIMIAETAAPPAWAYPEDWWLKFQHEQAEYMMGQFEKYTVNIGWDKVVGIIPTTPYSTAKHFKNMAPSGNWQIIDFNISQRGAYRPIPELAHHRTPVKNLYGTGSGWGNWSASSLCASYTCYKVMADDYGLRKPWEEQGRPY